jgi:hypothetical protein
VSVLDLAEIPGSDDLAFVVDWILSWACLIERESCRSWRAVRLVCRMEWRGIAAAVAS